MPPDRRARTWDDTIRDAALQPVPSQNRPYKAVVLLMLSGGVDSYNMLMPHSECSPHDLRADYDQIRGTDTNNGGQALPLSQVLSVTAANQPCNKFGIHGKLPFLKERYDAGDAAFLANTGALIEPVSLLDRVGRKYVGKQLPPSLFSHNSQQTQAEMGFSTLGGSVRKTGVLNRLAEALTTQDNKFATQLYSVKGNSKAVHGDFEATVLGTDKISKENAYRGESEYGEAMANMSSRVSNSMLSETFNLQVTKALERFERWGSVLDNSEYEVGNALKNSEGKLVGQLRQVARLMHAHVDTHVNSERDLFVVGSGGWDTHKENIETLETGFEGVDNALKLFYNELDSKGLWDNVTIIEVSDFGRKLKSNGRGTDHGWGGNYFVLGGAVKGGQILGKYPPSFNDSNPHMQGGGRMIPTTSWEGAWHAVAQWLGIEEGKMDDVFPNLRNFDSSSIITAASMFKAL